MKTESNPDLYVSSTAGELGCWVDPVITRMVQTGLEHCWVPDVGTYLESGRNDDSQWGSNQLTILNTPPQLVREVYTRH
jgi:hypothetical protein